VLGRVITADGEIDDAAWMLRCAAVRDALHRTRRSPRTAKDVLAELGGGDIAVATGVLLGATARRLPVLLDGPVGLAAGMISRDLAGQARHWCLLPDHGGHPAVRLAADVLGLTPLLDLRLDLGEGRTRWPRCCCSARCWRWPPPRRPIPGRPDGGARTGAGERRPQNDGEEFVEPEPAGGTGHHRAGRAAGDGLPGQRAG
jgi:hypothetical protein